MGRCPARLACTPVRRPRAASEVPQRVSKAFHSLGWSSTPWMERILMSFRFLASTAVSCAVVVALTTWLLADASHGARFLAALIGLVATISVMLLIAWGVAAEDETFVPAPAPTLMVAPVPASP